MRAHMHMRILKQRAGLLNSSTCIVYCRIPQLCSPFVHASIGQNGRGLIHGIVIFTCDDHYWPTNATSACDLCTFSGCLMGRLKKSDQVSHNMTQIASVLAVATVFVSLWTLISRQRTGAYTQDKNTYAGTWAKSAGRAYTRGGRNCGILWYMLQ